MINSTTSRAVYTGTGITGPFAFPFKIHDEGDLLVKTRETATGDERTLELNIDYTVAGVNNASGTVTLTEVLAAEFSLLIRRAPVLTQDTSIRNLGSYFAASHEDEFDRLIMQMQSLQDQLDRAVKLKDTITGIPQLTELEPETGKAVVGTGTGFSMATLDSSAVALPGAGRDVGTLSAYFLNNAVLNVKDFGGIGNGVADDTSPWQDALDQQQTAAAAGFGLRVWGPAGRYVTSETLHGGKGAGSFSSVVIEGDGFSYRGATGYVGTAIITTKSDRQAINFQGCKGAIIRGVSIIGQLGDYVVNNNLGSSAATPLVDDTLAASWDDPTLNGGVLDGRYNPYAAITIDAYSGAQPATHYPTNIQSYNKNFSTKVLIDRCFISGYTVGIANQPCDSDGNGDFTKVRDTWIERCKWGISVGNSQSRGLAVEDCQMSFFFAALTNNQHGRQSGKFGSTITNLNLFDGIHVFKLAAFFGGPITFQNLYAESLWKIGEVVQTFATTEYSYIFNNADLKFNNHNDARGVPARVLEGGNSGCFIFNGGTFGAFPSALGFEPQNLEFNGTYFRTDSARTNQYEKFFHNVLAGGLVAKGLRINGRCRIKNKHFNLDTGVAAVIPGVTGRWQFPDRTICIPMYGEWIQATSEGWDILPNPQGLLTPAAGATSGNAVSKTSGGTVVTLVNKELTITFGARTEAQFMSQGPLPGDAIEDATTGMIFAVRARVGLVVNAVAQTNYKSNGAGGYNMIAAFSTTVGALNIAVSRYYTPAHYLRGDFTAASAVITNVATDDGTKTFGAEMVDGDCLLSFEKRDMYIAQADGIIIGGGVNQGAGTITISGSSATRTQVRRRIDYVTRLPAANA